MTARRAACTALAVVMTLATPALADLKTACTETLAFGDAVTRIVADGWTPATDAANLSDVQIDALAWTLMIPYITGDRGGEATETLLDLQRRTVPGLFAKRDTESTRARVLLRDGAALTLTETRTLPGRTERVCHFALNTADDEALGQLDTSGFEGAPAVLGQIITILPEVME